MSFHGEELGGAAAGGLTGARLGSAVAPGLGTAIGLGLGALYGGIASRKKARRRAAPGEQPTPIHPLYEKAISEIGPEFARTREAVRRSLTGAGGPFGEAERYIAQNIALRPGLRGSGVSLIPQAQIAGQKAQAISEAEARLLTEESGQRAQLRREQIAALTGQSQFLRQLAEAREAERAAQRRGFQAAVSPALLEAVFASLLRPGHPRVGKAS